MFVVLAKPTKQDPGRSKKCFFKIGPLQLGSRDQIVCSKKNYIMGCNLKIARNGKSVSKIPK